MRACSRAGSTTTASVARWTTSTRSSIDADPSVSPDAREVWYDGVDQDCDARSDHDADQDGHEADQDGHEAEAAGGLDCDDTDATVSPDAAEVWYDGVDQDCNGASDQDADGDGFDADMDDCDDSDAGIHPGATDIMDDGVDQDCDGTDATRPAPADTGEPADRGGGGPPLRRTTTSRRAVGS